MGRSELVVTPIIHLNGDRKETLVTNLENAYKALRKACLALMQSAPNGRNFYPEPGRYERAYEQHTIRMQHLQEVLDSLSAEVNQIEEETKPYGA